MFLAISYLTLVLGFTPDTTTLPIPIAPAEQLIDDEAKDDNYTQIDCPNFMLPIQVDPKRQAGIASIILYVSADKGKTWQKAGEVKPDAEGIPFYSPGAGLYWFKVQVVSKDKVKEPADIYKGPVWQRVRVCPRLTAREKAN